MQCTQMMGDEVLFLGKLHSLRELKSQQRMLSRSQWKLEQTYTGHSGCCDLVASSRIEVERLREERETLVKRLHDIDSDIHELSELSNQLSCEASLRAISAPLDEYTHTLEQVNTTRHLLGMPELPTCHAYSQLKQLHQSAQMPGDDILLPGKAGKAHKSCPHCYKVVSRNAVTCPGCSGPCSKKRVMTTSTRNKLY